MSLEINQLPYGYYFRNTAFASLTVVFLLLVPGCAKELRSPGPVLSEPNPARSTTDIATRNEAVEHLVETARRQFRNNKLNASEETINRGLNIDPGNPALWHLLAKIRFLEGLYSESETFALRSINYTRDNRELSNQNWRLVAHARKKRGDSKGAKSALNKIRDKEKADGWLPW